MLENLSKVFVVIALQLIALGSMAQNFPLKGEVTNSSNEPLPNVTISSARTAATVISKTDGQFEIEASVGDSLLFSSVGYEGQTVVIKNRDLLRVEMATVANSMEDVVVIGYGTQKKSDLTGSIAGLKATDIEQSRSTDLITALQGKIPGARIFSQSGEPGAAMNIQIRGISSLYGSSSPLFVIDGIQYDINANEISSSGNANLGSNSNPLAMLNPSDIESIEVLKDASATAIYGSRGANGVVIVTTKSGKTGQSVTTYDGYVSFSKAANKLRMLNANDFIDYQRLVNPQSSLFYNTDENGEPDLNSPKDPYSLPQHDWQDEMMQQSVTQNHNTTLSGGAGKTTYSGGAGYLSEEGIIRNNTQKRYTMRLKVDHEASKKIKLGLNMNTSYTDLSGSINTGQANAWNGVLQQLITAKPIDYFDSDFDETIGYVTPLSIIDNIYKNTGTFKSIGNGYVDAEIFKDLKLNISGGGIISSSKGKEFYSRFTTLGNNNNGVGIIQERRSFNWYNTNRLTYDKSFNDNNRLNVMAAFEVNGYLFESSMMRNNSYPDEITGIDDISKGAIVTGLNSEKWVNNRLSWLSRINYTLLNRYLFTASFRADGSDKFGAGNKYGYFPSFAFAWKVDQENFLKDVSAISDLKLRLSYGETGNERIPAYSYAGKMVNAYYAADGISAYGLAPSSLANPNLKWETTVQYNAGLDLGLLKNRLTFTADFYLKQTKDMLLPVLIPSQSGYKQQWQNIGKIDNKGIEFQVTSQNIQQKDFQWTTNFNISFNSNKIRSLGSLDYIPVVMDNGVITNLGRVSVGQQLGTAYGYVFDGVYQISQFDWQNNSDPSIPHAERTYSLKPGEVNVAGTAVLPGSFKFKDLNNDGIVDENSDRTFISNSLPKHFGGINNTFNYKNFELNVFFEWSYGAEIFNLGKIALEGLSNNNNISKDFYDNRWTPENPTNEYGDFRGSNGLTGGNTTYRFASSYYVEDASYLRMRNLTLNYHLPKNWIGKIGLKGAKVYVTGNNLWLLTDYSGYDPDVSFSDPLFSGFDRISYPRVKSFIIGAAINF
ncbi:SusC/RagA family TonB-linked outer membrane protein [Niabella ginsengisoli]|uniref:TonB-dependent receptor n=1 Tax=Niabella ginsengisoli TaxID=522298 RepID=A0ABS9SIN8_9BACT|nr:TonB-dependent receptor [Niabella ginsengisoli]MCH5598233.1 TonB-dependent receptor [Niabella ginsengisoli]